MTDGIETLAESPAEQQALSNGTGWLDIIHQRWLERTAGGDGTLIADELVRLTATDRTFDSEACIPLLDGHIALIAKEHIQPGGLDAIRLLEVGKQAVQGYVERVVETSEKPKLEDAVDAIEAAFTDDPEPSADTLTNGPPLPRIRRVPQQQYRSSSPTPRTGGDPLRGLAIANHQRNHVAKMKVSLCSGEMHLAEVLEDPVAEKVPISKLLIHIPRIGQVTMNDILKSARLAPETEIGTLNAEEKVRLVESLPAPKKPTRQYPVSPDRGDQHLRALKKANETRSYRSKLKDKLRIREITVDELFADEVGSGMKLGEVIASLPTRRPLGGAARPKTGKSKSNTLRDRVLEETNLLGNKRCNELTPRQRQKVLDCLAARDKGYAYSWASKTR